MTRSHCRPPRSATRRRLEGKRRNAVDAAANYLLDRKRYLRYQDYLRDGLAIATGVIEGACRSLVCRTGHQPDGACRVPRPCSRRAPSGPPTIWTSTSRELERNHLCHYDRNELIDLREAP